MSEQGVYEIHVEGMDGDLYCVDETADLGEAEELAEQYAHINGRVALVLEPYTDDPYLDYLYSTEEA